MKRILGFLVSLSLLGSSVAQAQTPATTPATTTPPPAATTKMSTSTSKMSTTTSQAPADGRQTTALVLKVQVPGVTSHWSQAPPHAVLQQNPSTQLPDVHWAALVQTPPFASCGWQVVPAQYWVAGHVDWSLLQRRGMTKAEIKWVENYLVPMKAAGLVETLKVGPTSAGGWKGRWF